MRLNCIMLTPMPVSRAEPVRSSTISAPRATSIWVPEPWSAWASAK